MNLPTLDTVSFDAHFPLYRALAQHSEQRMRVENSLLLRLITAPDDELNAPPVAPILTRIEAKLDVSLYLHLQQREWPDFRSTWCRIGLETLVWHEPENTAPPNTPHIAYIQLSEHWPLPLVVSCHIDHAAPDCNGTFWRAELSTAFDETTRLHWEKWVFSHHRRTIQNRRTTSSS